MATGVLHDGEGLTDACIRYLNKGEKKKKPKQKENEEGSEASAWGPDDVLRQMLMRAFM